MVIIKCNIHLKADEFTKTWEGLVEMADSGVILLPPGMELLNEVPADSGIIITKEGGVNATD